MNKFLRRINRPISLGSASTLIAVSLAIGFILGFFRTKLIYSHFNDFSTGAYFVAFEIPDLIFYTLSAGALSVAFIPILSDKVFTANLKQAWRLTSSVLNSISLIMLIVSLTLVLFPRPVIEIIATGFSPERAEITAQIMRLAAINPLVFSITSIFASVQQLFGRFVYFAVAPLFYNLSIILSIYLFKDSMGVVGLGLGVALGALLNVFILALGMNRLDFRHSWIFGFKDRAFLQVVRALPARSLNQGIVYFNSIVQTRIASEMPIQAISSLKGALYLYHAPAALLGMALGTVAFPRFTKHLAEGRQDLFHQEFLFLVKVIVWLAVPIVAFSFASRDYWARIIFSAENSEIAMIFGWLTLGITFRALYAIVCRFYYAQKDTITPLMATILVLVSNVILSYWLADRFGVSGLGMATSLVAILEIAVLGSIIWRRHNDLFHWRFVRELALILAIGAVAFGAALASGQWLPFEGQDADLSFFAKLAAILGLTFAVHFGLSHFFRIREAKAFWRYFFRLALTVREKLAARR